MNYLTAALEYWQMGFNVLPVKETKAPAWPQWQRWQTEKQTEEEVREMFSQDHWGMALITGFNNLEVIDVDLKADTDGKIVEYFKADLKSSPYNLVKDYAAQKTLNDGAHLLYRMTSRPPGSHPIAKKLDNGVYRAIIETRGDKGIVVVSPTPGYTMAFKENLTSMLMDEERSLLMELCKSYDEFIPPPALPPRSQSFSPSHFYDDERPWDVFNREHGAEYAMGVLENHGWQRVGQRGDRILLRRPGKDEGHSANFHVGMNLLKVHSTSTEFDTDTAYSPFAITAVLEFNNDYGAAIRGLGLNKEAPAPLPVAGQAAPVEGKWKDVFVYNPLDDGDVDEDWTVMQVRNGKQYGVAAPGLAVSLSGHEKARKTALAYTMILAGLAGKPFLGFQWLKPMRKALIFDTEQSPKWIKRSAQRMKKTVPAELWQGRIEIYGLKKYSDAERLAFIKEKVQLCPEVDVILIDGIADLCDDFNDLQKSKAVVHELINLSPTAFVIGVIHLNKGNNEERGHLGAIYKQKSDVIIRVTLDEDNVSQVRNYRSRDLPFPDFAFSQDKDGLVTESGAYPIVPAGFGNL